MLPTDAPDFGGSDEVAFNPCRCLCSAYKVGESWWKKCNEHQCALVRSCEA